MAKSGYRVVAPDRYLRCLPADGTVTVALEELDLPRADVLAALEDSGLAFACRWKGEAVHFHVRAGDRRVEDGAWSYAEPPADLAALAGLVAFDAEAFEIELRAGPGPA